jgi:hypothetical protein
LESVLRVGIVMVKNKQMQNNFSRFLMKKRVKKSEIMGDCPFSYRGLGTSLTYCSYRIYNYGTLETKRFILKMILSEDDSEWLKWMT